jgi:hypothetical protein
MTTTPLETVLVTGDAPKYFSFVAAEIGDSLTVGLLLLVWVPIVLCFWWQSDLLNGDKFCICELHCSNLLLVEEKAT